MKRHTPVLVEQRGAALLEALIAILIFSLGVLGLIGLLATSTQFSIDAEDRTRASMLANDLVAQMWEKQTVSLDSDTLSAWESRVQDPSNGLPSANANSTVDASGVANVTITWKAPWRPSAEQSNIYSTQVQIP
ncbi:type IV pilus modification protein PilV [Candidatus Dactylopiibacterium carminicum]|nr:type IV pilus modification protein PilV [Candidatus Dactylopiibacterium carminicum]